MTVLQIIFTILARFPFIRMILFRKYFAKGQEFSDDGNFKESAYNFSLAIILNKNSLEAYQYMANALEELEEYRKCVKVYLSAIEIFREDPVLYYELGRIYGIIREPEKVIRYLKKAVELNPEDAFSYSLLGHAYNDVGKTESAKKCFDRAHEIDPSIT